MGGLKRLTQSGFTLVEMLVVAPIVILSIGAFIALIVNLTGEVMSSRGSNVLAYNIQDALNRIEDDVKLSAGFLATNNIAFTASNPQGRGAVNSTTNFNAIDATNGNALILNEYVTDGNPLSINSGILYLANQPNDCSDYSMYSKNRPMTMNVIYFIDSNGTLWRRTVMPTNYATPSAYCGSNGPWQLPSCINDTSRSAFCKTNDEKLLDNVGISGLTIQYFNSASSTTPLSITSSSTTADLQPATTAVITINSNTTIAGRDVSRSGTLRVSRLDTNASAVGDLHDPTTAPNAPILASTIANGHQVTFTWPRVANATSYTLQYKVNGGSLSSPVTLDNNSRSYTVNAGWNGDTVQAQVKANNSAGSSSTASNSTNIPVWASLVMQGSWTDYANGYGTAAYTRTSSGMVLLKGLVRNPSSPGSGSVIGKLPTDYAPSARLILGTSTSTGSSNGQGRLEIDAAGNVIMASGTGSWFSLDTARYMAGNAGYTRTNITSFLNGWSNYGSVYVPASYSQDNTGRVFIQGTLNPGTLTDGTDIFNIPASIAPPQYQHFASSSIGGWSHIGVVSSPAAVEAKGTGSGVYSVNANYLPASYSGSTWSNLSLVNSWVNYGGSYPTAQYTKTNDGVVTLRGLIKGGSTAYDSVITTLPAGFRPKNRILYTGANTGAYARLDILSNGEVHFLGSTNGWLSLDNINFVAEQ